MTHFKLSIQPGIARDVTDYSNTGRWWDCQWVRFRNGFPEKMGGWSAYSTSAVVGPVRAIRRFSLLNGSSRLAIGTRGRLYIERGSLFQDITPARLELTATVATVNTSTTVTLTFGANHGAAVNDVITIAGTGVTAIDYNTSTQIHHIVTAVPTTTTLRITLSAAASSTSSYIGCDVVFLIKSGSKNAFTSGGWGAGGWGLGGWGQGISSGSFSISNLGTWSLDNFGEDVIAGYRYSKPYYWDASTPTARAIAFEDLPGASNAPTIVTKLIVSEIDRHVVALGVNPIGESTIDPMFIRWSAQEDAATWTPSTANSSGDYRLDTGTEIITAVKTRQETVIFTNAAIYSMQFVGGNDVFRIDRVAMASRIIGWHAAVAHMENVYWMASDGFYVYNGQVRKIPCPIERYILGEVNYGEKDKVYAGTNSAFNEVWWFYPSGTTSECDKYVVYNYAEDCWYYGTAARTVILDDTNTDYVLTSIYNSSDNSARIYVQDYGIDDYTTPSAAAIPAYVLSSPIEIGDGDNFMFADKVIHDVSFRNSTASTPTMNFSLYSKRYPMSAYNDQETVSIEDGDGTLLIEKATEYHRIRVRGRQVSIKYSSTDSGVIWRAGVPRLNVRPDGKK